MLIVSGESKKVFLLSECARAWQGLGESGVDRIVLDCLETQYSDGNMAADRSTFVMYDVNGKQIDNGE